METIQEAVDRMVAESDKMAFEVFHRIVDLVVSHEVTVEE